MPFPSLTAHRDAKHERVKGLLLSHREDVPVFWLWMSELHGKPADKKSANKFLLLCILDWQMRVETVRENARRLAEGHLGDPEDLWDRIADIPEPVWESRRQEYSLHRFPRGHYRVWKIGNEVVRRYQGDARKIWVGQTTDVILGRLNEMQVGRQISRMIVGALIDTDQVSGRGDLKADLHVTRVLGRVFEGQRISSSEADRHARMMLPGDTWPLDRPLYKLGQRVCRPSGPLCHECYLSEECEYNRRWGGTISRH